MPPTRVSKFMVVVVGWTQHAGGREGWCGCGLWWCCCFCSNRSLTCCCCCCCLLFVVVVVVVVVCCDFKVPLCWPIRRFVILLP